MESIVVGNPSLHVGHGHVNVALDSDSAIIAFFAPIMEECRRTGHSTAERSRSSEQSTRAQISPQIVFLGGREVFFDGTSSSDVIWFGVCVEMLDRGRERTSGTRHGQTNKPSSEATLPASLLEVSGIETEKGNAPSLL